MSQIMKAQTANASISTLNTTENTVQIVDHCRRHQVKIHLHVHFIIIFRRLRWFFQTFFFSHPSNEISNCNRLERAETGNGTQVFGQFIIKSRGKQREATRKKCDEKNL